MKYLEMTAWDYVPIVNTIRRFNPRAELSRRDLWGFRGLNLVDVVLKAGGSAFMGFGVSTRSMEILVGGYFMFAYSECVGHIINLGIETTVSSYKP